MKDQAIVCNIGHFDNEIQVDSLEASSATHTNIKPQVDKYTFSSGNSIYTCWHQEGWSISVALQVIRVS